MNKIIFVNDDYPAISAENLNQMQENIEQSISGNVLWTNTNPTSGFSQQTINLSSSILNYKVIEIYYYVDLSDPHQASFKMYVGGDFSNEAYIQCQSGRRFAWRFATLSGTTINFTDGKRADSYATLGTTNNSVIIPLVVIGY